MALTKTERRLRIRRRIRKTVSGTADIPRLSVFRSNKQIYIQVVDDASGKTLFEVSSLNKEIEAKKNISKIERSKMVGKLLAEEAKKKGITSVVFDRGGYMYHGRIKELADAAREGGLKF
jgi:large subunit ribosomal protein L18